MATETLLRSIGSGETAAKVQASTVIRRPIEEVFAFISELENLPRWDPLVQEIRKTSTGPIGVGTTYRASVRMMGIRGEVGVRYVAFEPGQRIAFENSRFGPWPPIAPRWELSLTPAWGGARVTFRANPNPQGPFKRLSPLIAVYGTRVWSNNLALLKDLLESAAAASLEQNVESWAQYDLLGALQQVGVVPPLLRGA